MTSENTGKGITSLVVETHPKNSPLVPHEPDSTYSSGLKPTISCPASVWLRLNISYFNLMDLASGKCFQNSSQKQVHYRELWPGPLLDSCLGRSGVRHWLPLAFLSPLGVDAIWLSICRCQGLDDIQIFPSGWTSLAKCGLSAHICPPGWSHTGY